MAFVSPLLCPLPTLKALPPFSRSFRSLVESRQAMMLTSFWTQYASQHVKNIQKKSVATSTQISQDWQETEMDVRLCKKANKHVLWLTKEMGKNLSITQTPVWHTKGAHLHPTHVTILWTVHETTTRPPHHLILVSQPPCDSKLIRAPEVQTAGARGGTRFPGAGRY